MPSISTLRRRAAVRGLRLITYRDNSRWFAQYGPYALADVSTNALIVSGLELDGVVAALSE